ncbi:MAG: AAC(3) family N-acetyltransferase [Bacteroidota bacterium]
MALSELTGPAIKAELTKYLKAQGAKDILVHSDVLFGYKIPFESKDQFLRTHWQMLSETCEDLRLIFPAFNYDFCQGRPFDAPNDPSQVGTLSEFARTKASWRTPVPVFSFAGFGATPQVPTTGTIDPFDENSLFGRLHKDRGLLMHYGSGLHTTTLIHYVERISGQLIYRYDKDFHGEVKQGGTSTHVHLKYHVRPLGQPLKYDWARLQDDLQQQGILRRFHEKRTNILVAEIHSLVEYWLRKLRKDPFYLLETETRHWVEAKYHELRRPFQIQDFE